MDSTAGNYTLTQNYPFNLNLLSIYAASGTILGSSLAYGGQDRFISNLQVLWVETRSPSYTLQGCWISLSDVLVTWGTLPPLPPALRPPPLPLPLHTPGPSTPHLLGLRPS